MKCLIDANILIDVLDEREPHYKDSAYIWKLCETKQIKGYISVLTYANLVYILRRALDPRQVENVLQVLMFIFEFVELTPTDLTKAAHLGWRDYEDAIQYVTAEKLQADYIVSRNTKDFTDDKVKAIIPRDLIQLIKESL